MNPFHSSSWEEGENNTKLLGEISRDGIHEGDLRREREKSRETKREGLRERERERENECERESGGERVEVYI